MTNQVNASNKPIHPRLGDLCLVRESRIHAWKLDILDNFKLIFDPVTGEPSRYAYVGKLGTYLYIAKYEGNEGYFATYEECPNSLPLHEPNEQNNIK